MFDPVKVFEDIADDNGFLFMYGARHFQNWEITGKDLTDADTFLGMFPFEETGQADNGSIASWTVNTIIIAGRKFDTALGVHSSLDETEKQKYDRRLKYLRNVIETVLNNLCAVKGIEITSARVFRELNKFDENTDYVGCELSFVYDSGYDNTIPDYPVALAATNVISTGFSANWQAVTGATGYYIDVSASASFATYLTGYNNKSVGNVLTLVMTGLTSGQTYYYRVRSYNGYNQSLDSVKVTVILP